MSKIITFYIMVSGEDLDFSEIEKLLRLKPSVTMRKNDSTYGNHRAEKDVWYYSISRKVNSVKKISDAICSEWKILCPNLLSNKNNINILRASLKIIQKSSFVI